MKEYPKSYKLSVIKLNSDYGRVPAGGVFCGGFSTYTRDRKPSPIDKLAILVLPVKYILRESISLNDRDNKPDINFASL